MSTYPSVYLPTYEVASNITIAVHPRTRTQVEARR